MHPKRYVDIWKTAETPWIQNPEFKLQSETTRHLRPLQVGAPPPHPRGKNIWGQNMLWWTTISNTYFEHLFKQFFDYEHQIWKAIQQ